MMPSLQGVLASNSDFIQVACLDQRWHLALVVPDLMWRVRCDHTTVFVTCGNLLVKDPYMPNMSSCLIDGWIGDRFPRLHRLAELSNLPDPINTVVSSCLLSCTEAPADTIVVAT